MGDTLHWGGVSDKIPVTKACILTKAERENLLSDLSLMTSNYQAVCFFFNLVAGPLH